MNERWLHKTYSIELVSSIFHAAAKSWNSCIDEPEIKAKAVQGLRLGFGDLDSEVIRTWRPLVRACPPAGYVSSIS